MNPLPTSGAGPAMPSRRTGILAVIIVVTALLLSVVLADLVKPKQTGPDSVSLQSSAMAPMTATTVSSTKATGASHVSVAIQNYAFSPSALSISQGTTVTWTNHDVAPHTVTVSSGPVKFSSPTLQQGQSFSYTFTTPGTYAYYCAVHPDMRASVTVVAKATPTPSPAPSTPPTPSSGPSTPMPMGGSTSSCSGISAAEQAFLVHVYAGHLGESPSQQAADILNANQYAKTHTVLVANMVSPVVDGLNGALSMFLTHVYTGHLGESPSQQAADILNASQYVKTHTVLVGNMAQSIVGNPGC